MRSPRSSPWGLFGPLPARRSPGGRGAVSGRGLGNAAAAGLEAVGNTLKANSQSSALFGTASQQYLRDRAAADAINALTGTNIRAADILARTEGKIVNQNLELLFNGVSLRPFNFAWDLTPRDEKEAGVIREILYKLKQSSAARRSVIGDSTNLTYDK